MTFAQGWTDLTLEESWVVQDDLTPAYRVDGQGVVWLHGALSGDTGTLAATVPEGCRPAQDGRWIVATSGDDVAKIDVAVNGEITISSDSVVYLTGVAFLAEPQEDES